MAQLKPIVVSGTWFPDTNPEYLRALDDGWILSHGSQSSGTIEGIGDYVVVVLHKPETLLQAAHEMVEAVMRANTMQNAGVWLCAVSIRAAKDILQQALEREERKEER